MTQEERIHFLLEYLIKESPQNLSIPQDYSQKRILLRSIVNVRPPKPALDEFLKVQDDFLRQETLKKGVVDAAGIKPCKLDGRISLWKGDITRLKIDAIVNAANSGLLGCFNPGHNCIDNAIHTAAGIELRQECWSIMEKQRHLEKTGCAKITKGYNLPAKYVIHTVGPIVVDVPSEDQMWQLADCYRASLNAAISNNINTIAFCCISTGVFAFPKELAAKIAVNEISYYLKNDKRIKQIVFNVFSNQDHEIYKKLLG